MIYNTDTNALSLSLSLFLSLSCIILAIDVAFRSKCYNDNSPSLRVRNRFYGALKRGRGIAISATRSSGTEIRPALRPVRVFADHSRIARGLGGVSSPMTLALSSLFKFTLRRRSRRRNPAYLHVHLSSLVIVHSAISPTDSRRVVLCLIRKFRSIIFSYRFLKSDATRSRERRRLTRDKYSKSA